MDAKTFGGFIARVRRERGMTQAEAAGGALTAALLFLSGALGLGPVPA